jgi:hypothetical protein
MTPAAYAAAVHRSAQAAWQFYVDTIRPAKHVTAIEIEGEPPETELVFHVDRPSTYAAAYPVFSPGTFVSIGKRTVTLTDGTLVSDVDHFAGALVEWFLGGDRASRR